MVPIAVVPQLFRPVHPRPIQPVRTSEVLIALAVIGAMALLLTGGFVLGRMESRRKARSRIKGTVSQRVGRRKAADARRKLRLVKRP